MGLADFLSPALNVATQAAGAYQGAEAGAAQQRQQQIVQAIQMKRQQEEQAVKDALARAQTSHFGIQDRQIQYNLDHPKPQAWEPATKDEYLSVHPRNIDPLSPQGVTAKQGLIDYETQHGYHAPQMPFEPTPIIDPTNPNAPPQVGTFDKRTGKVAPTGFGKPASQGSGGTGAFMDARLGTAAEQATTADQVMRAYEQKLLSGQASISTAGIIAAKTALSGGATTSSVAESALNKTDPELASYIRAAKAIATAERLITPRGGSNALMQAEGMLSAAGPGANPALIQQAQHYRAALLKGLASHHPGSQAAGPASAQSSESELSDADLWEKKREEGLTPDQATAYVGRRRH